VVSGFSRSHFKVIAYMSQVHIDPDLAVELFVLEPKHGSSVEWTRKSPLGGFLGRRNG